MVFKYLFTYNKMVCCHPWMFLVFSVSSKGRTESVGPVQAKL